MIETGFDRLINDAMSGLFDADPGGVPKYSRLWDRLDALGLRAESQRFATALKRGRLPEELDNFHREKAAGRP